MPEISMLGWFHTIMGIVALLSGYYTLFRYKVIGLTEGSSKIYLITTFVSATSALFIFRHGGFGIAHGLAVLTLIALIGGTICAKGWLFGKFAPYLQAVAYSATLLFHMIPAITDGLMRLPVGDPVVNDIHDPLLKKFYLVFLLAYLIGVTSQILWLRKRTD